MSNITPDDFKRLKHMLGATEQYKKREWGFRNYYAASIGGESETSMQRLVEAGYAKAGQKSQHMAYYHATLEGCVFAGLHKAAIKRAFED